MPVPITDKYQMYRLLTSGRLGHTLPSAETVDAARALMARYPDGLFAIRLKQAGGRTRYNLTPAQILETITVTSGWNVSPMLSDPHRVCYGHFLDAVGGWDLYFSTDPKPCKLMPSKDGCTPRRLYRTAARTYLRSIMDDVSWANFLRLVKEYPDHVIEFTVMTDSRHAFGDSNTVFWEVRSTCGRYEQRSGWAG